MSQRDFRDNLIAPDSPRILNARGLDPFDYAKPILERPDARFLVDSWMDLYDKPFKGITADGELQSNLFHLGDEGLDIASIARAGETLLKTLDEEQARRIQYPINAHEWRSWYNPEFPMNSNGLRLDYVSAEVRETVANLMRVSLGPEGYRKTEQCRSANLYLGELYDLRNIMNEWSYHFLLFGIPSLTEPWGWSIFGHHLAVNCFLLGRQIVVSPVFLGFEPNIVDRGKEGAFRSFAEEEEAGLALIRSLSPELREKAVTYKLMVDPAMPEGRWHFADERQLGAAFRDNSVIPPEGVAAASLSKAQQQKLMDLVAVFLEFLPKTPREAHLRQISQRLGETYFSWIGGYGEEDAFYYRVQSPVIMLEFDHHSGVWLTNAEPAKFHTHVVVRTPNGNDYGKELLRLHYAQMGRPAGQFAEVDRDPISVATRDRLRDRTPPPPITRAEHDKDHG